jgi:hypothetical protein
MTNEPKDSYFDPGVKIDVTTEAEKVITVESIAHTGLDGKRVPPGKICKISIKQWRALSRHFRWIDGPIDHAPDGWIPSGMPATAAEKP